MPDRTIIFAQNGRHGLRGISALNPAEFEAYHEDDDALTYTFDLASYLGSDTISSVTRTPSGPTVSNEANTTTQLTQRLKGAGHVDFKVTTAGGDIEEFRLFIRQRVSTSVELNQAAEVPDPMAQTYTSTSDPTRNDDTGDGHWVGRFWLNTATKNLFFCKDNTAGAAIWGFIPRTLAVSGTASSVTGTLTETTLATITIPANCMGANGALLLDTVWSMTSSGNNKILRGRFSGASGTSYIGLVYTATGSARDLRVIQNRNSTSSQISGGLAAKDGGVGGANGAAVTSSVDTTVDTTILLQGTLANTGETITLESYRVELVRPDIT